MSDTKPPLFMEWVNQQKYPIGTIGYLWTGLVRSLQGLNDWPRHAEDLDDLTAYINAKFTDIDPNAHILIISSIKQAWFSYLIDTDQSIAPYEGYVWSYGEWGRFTISNGRIQPLDAAARHSYREAQQRTKG